MYTTVLDDVVVEHEFALDRIVCQKLFALQQTVRILIVVICDSISINMRYHVSDRIVFFENGTNSAFYVAIAVQ